MAKAPYPTPLRSRASAPGKLILFGEHAVVYGHTAVAVALSSMRVTVEAELCDDGDGTLEATLHDLPSACGRGPVRADVPLSALAAAMLPTRASEERSDDGWRTPLAAGARVIEALHRELGGAPEADKAALVPLLFLAASLLPQLGARVGGRLRVGVRSAGLPVGAGLGSSAAFSVAVAAALLRLQLLLRERLGSTAASDLALLEGGPRAADGAATSAEAGGAKAGGGRSGAGGSGGRVAGTGEEGCREAETSTPSSAARELINGWAYCAECILHGTPSGLDNAVSCEGGGMRLQRAGRESGAALRFEPIASLRPMTVLVTNTNVPRSTRCLVTSRARLARALPQPSRSLPAGASWRRCERCATHSPPSPRPSSARSPPSPRPSSQRPPRRRRGRGAAAGGACVHAHCTPATRPCRRGSARSCPSSCESTTASSSRSESLAPPSPQRTGPFRDASTTRYMPRRRRPRGRRRHRRGTRPRHKADWRRRRRLRNLRRRRRRRRQRRGEQVGGRRAAPPRGQGLQLPPHLRRRRWRALPRPAGCGRDGGAGGAVRGARTSGCRGRSGGGRGRARRRSRRAVARDCLRRVASRAAYRTL